ncbi:MAG: hypothetical protein IJQ77_05495 [Synergistaceae bacterium]|nr:hypothetical protein [Synergistaceae bacterium]MBR0250516.1 hypothetical protein [Synergistaceae bacterium]
MGCLVIIILCIFLPGLFPILMEILINAIPFIIQLLPDLIQAIASVITAIIGAIAGIIMAVIHIFPSLADYVKENPFISLGAAATIVIIAVVISKK